MSLPTGPLLRAEALSLAYDSRLVVRDLTLEIPPNQITMIVGANASGKSTLLRGLSRLMAPASGTVTLDGRSIHRMATRALATQVGILPQSARAPDGMTVVDLVTRGRYPHRRAFQRWSPHDHDMVTAALVATSMVDLADRPVDELSGGQRQRAWIAMALAQDTTVLLLDEPTTFLDLAHQVEVLDLITDLHRDRGRTVVAVLHDLNHACRYAHHLVAMRDGAIVAQGDPGKVMTEDLVREVFGLDARVVPDPVSGSPMVVPIGRHHRSLVDGAHHGVTTVGT